MDKQQVEERIVEVLRTVYDPEIPANIYDLGLIYRVDYNPNDSSLDIDMTLTAPGCPLADFIMEDVRQKVLSVEGVKTAQVNSINVFDILKYDTGQPGV